MGPDQFKTIVAYGVAILVGSMLVGMLAGRLVGGKKEESEDDELADYVTKRVTSTPTLFMDFVNSALHDGFVREYFVQRQISESEQKKKMILSILLSNPNIKCEQHHIGFQGDERGDVWNEVPYVESYEEREKIYRALAELALSGNLQLRFSSR
jgi:hypothetical protein